MLLRRIAKIVPPSKAMRRRILRGSVPESAHAKFSLRAAASIEQTQRISAPVGNGGTSEPHCGQRRATPRRPLPLPFATSTRASSNASREPNARQASDTPPGAGLAVTITPRSPRLSQASAAAYTSPNRPTQMAKRAPLSSAKQTRAAIVSETNAPAKPARNSLGHSGRSQARFPTPSAGPATKVYTFAPKRKPSAGAAQLCTLLLAQQT